MGKFIRACLVLMVVAGFSAGTVPAFAGEDAHFIQGDDYFVSNEKLDDAWMYVFLSKMKTPPSSQSKNEGLFMKVTDGKDIWTQYFWQTAMAGEDSLVIGTLVIAFDDNARDNVYGPPEKKDHARKGQWFMAKITDTSDLYKGYVTVSGGYKVSVSNLRIIGEWKGSGTSGKQGSTDGSGDSGSSKNSESSGDSEGTGSSREFQSPDFSGSPLDAVSPFKKKK